MWTVYALEIISIVLSSAPDMTKHIAPPALAAYLRLAPETMAALLIHALEPPEPKTPQTNGWVHDADSNSDSEGPDRRVEVVSSFKAPVPRPSPVLDGKARTRLQTLPSPAHLNALLGAVHKQTSDAAKEALVGRLQALSTVWPARTDRIAGAVFAWSGGGLVSEVYRGYVRRSPLGHAGNVGVLTGASLWFSVYG